MKPHEETWKADEMGCVYLRGARRIATFAYNGQTNVETGDGAHARARLAAQAPAMARALTTILEAEIWHEDRAMAESVLRAAGAIP